MNDCKEHKSPHTCNCGETPARKPFAMVYNGNTIAVCPFVRGKSDWFPIRVAPKVEDEEASVEEIVDDLNRAAEGWAKGLVDQARKDEAELWAAMGGVNIQNLKKKAVEAARAEELERCAKALCWRCEDVEEYGPAVFSGGEFCHAGTDSGMPELTCHANAIRRGAAK